MSEKPIFCATHPRACSTAFERVFMTCRDQLKCIHEPFGDAYYFGPERLVERYANDAESRIQSGFQETTYQDIMDRINRENAEGKRLFIKDMAQYLLPPDGKPASIAPSLLHPKRGIGTNGANGNSLAISAPLSTAATGVEKAGADDQEKRTKLPFPTAAEPGNPSIMPDAMLRQFHFAFLIRHPRYSIPSYYRCTVPPLDQKTGFYNFMPSEAGYHELRCLFDYLRQSGQVGPKMADGPSSNRDWAIDIGGSGKNAVEICVLDADDVLDNPAGMVEAFCKAVGIRYDPGMLNWDNEEDQRFAQEAFEKWLGFHDDALNSKGLSPRLYKKNVKSNDEQFEDWKARYGYEGAKVIRDTVDSNVADYEYLKRFALKL